MISRAWKIFCDITDYLERSFASILVGGLALYFTVGQLTQLTKDTTTITNAGFALMASLAALCFSYARCLDDQPSMRSEVIHAGERFFHAAILLLTASLIKYAALACMEDPAPVEVLNAVLEVVGQIFGYVALLLFVRASFFASTATIQITDHLWRRPRKSLREVEDEIKTAQLGAPTNSDNHPV